MEIEKSRTPLFPEASLIVAPFCLPKRSSPPLLDRFDSRRDIITRE